QPQHVYVLLDGERRSGDGRQHGRVPSDRLPFDGRDHRVPRRERGRGALPRVRVAGGRHRQVHPPPGTVRAALRPQGQAGLLWKHRRCAHVRLHRGNAAGFRGRLHHVRQRAGPRGQVHGVHQQRPSHSLRRGVPHGRALQPGRRVRQRGGLIVTPEWS
ncbi:unnamed protein product, partial [Ectocarpus sp. 13 AM-2016]